MGMVLSIKPRTAPVALTVAPAIEQFLEVAVADTRGAGVGVIRAAVA